MECGVWRGGVVIFMRGALEAYGDDAPRVWAADSFAGLPKPDGERYPADTGNDLWTDPDLAVSLADVREAFGRYGLLDERVRFVEGWFRRHASRSDRRAAGPAPASTGTCTSRPWLPCSRSTRSCRWGYVIVDDYQPKHPGCVRAVDEFLAEHGSGEQLRRAGAIGAYGQRAA